MSEVTIRHRTAVLTALGHLPADSSQSLPYIRVTVGWLPTVLSSVDTFPLDQRNVSSISLTRSRRHLLDTASFDRLRQSLSLSLRPWLGLTVVPVDSIDMIEELTCRCEGDNCNRRLTENDCMVIYRTDEGERRAYECACGNVTITVHK